MASKDTRKKTKKGKDQSNDLDPADGESMAMLWLMKATKAWCNAPTVRSERTARKKLLGEIMQVEVQSVKNFYNQGQIKSKHVFPVVEAVSGCPQEDIISFFENYAFYKDKMTELPAEKRRLLSLFAQLTDNEVFILNRLLEAGLEANRALQKNQDNED